MQIDSGKCINCGICVACCPANALIEAAGRVKSVDESACFECGLCRMDFICPEGAFIESERTGEMPRIMRSLFSDPNTTHKSTMVPGRGTEESKTNDVTGQVRRGDLGLCIELGRPGIGCSFRDVSRMTECLKNTGVRFISGNPLVSLMDEVSGRISEDLAGERILSAIIEVVFPEEDLEKVLDEIFRIGKGLGTVFSLSMISRFDEKGELPVLGRLELLGLTPSGSAKVNMGLGFPLAEGDART